LDTQVLQRLISKAALENETKRIGLSVGDVEVQRQLLATQAFRGLDGQFDRDTYEFSLERNNLTAREYEASIRAQTAGTILQSAILSGYSVPGTYAKVMMAYMGERRSFSWVELNAQNVTATIPTPTDTDLKTYFDSNGDNYVLAASKRLTYVWLTPESVTDQVQVEDDTLRAIYKDRSADYNTPERRLVERLIFATMAEAQAALATIRSGEKSFDDVVADRGLALSDIDLGDVTKSSLSVAGDVVFSLTEPGLSDAVETDLGPGLFRVNAILSARSTPFEDVRDVLMEEVAADNARRLVADQIAEFDDLLAGGATLEDLASETDMQLGRIDWNVANTDGIAAYDGFSNVAAQATADDFPIIETLDDGGIFALRVDEIVPERPDSFENARTQVEIDWRATELASALEADTALILASLSGGATLSSLGYPVTVETNAKRDKVFLDKPREFLNLVFEFETNGAGSVAGTGRVIIMQLNKVSAADPQDPAGDILEVAINDDIAQTFGQDALAAFTRALQQSAGISLNQTAINAVHAQFSGFGG
ncbi:MAG: peptidyl-prolyl cis-trans isomerase, partial [Paracoccaceae bacterium]